MDILSMILARSQGGGGSGGGMQEPTTKTISCTVIPETELELSEEEGVYFGVLPDYIPCTDCTIHWNGKPFECSPKDGTADFDAYHVFGNLSFFGGEDTGEPFLFIIADVDGTTLCNIITVEPPADATKIKVTIDHSFTEIPNTLNPSLVIWRGEGAPNNLYLCGDDIALMDKLSEQSSFMCVVKLVYQANNDTFQPMTDTYNVLMYKADNFAYGVHFVGKLLSFADDTKIMLAKDEDGKWYS